MSPPQLLVDRYHDKLSTLRLMTAAGLARAWDRLDSYDREDAESFATTTAPLLAGAKTATVATSAAFFSLALGTRAASVSAADVETSPRITDPFLATWHALAEGRPSTEAIAAGRSQAEATANDYVQSTARRAGDVIARASGRTVRWRRIPNAGACAWCITVAGQLYHSAESADFGHDRCFCITVPA